MSRFLVVSGACTALRLSVRGVGSVRLGRSLECEIQVTEDGIQPLHAEIVLGPPLSVRALAPEVAVMLGPEAASSSELERPVEPGATDWVGPQERIRVGPLELLLAEGLPSDGVPRLPDLAEPNWHIPSVDPAMRAVEDLLQQAAASEDPVLVLGDTGTGKDVTAREIHRRSTRASGPFLRVGAVEIGDEGFASSILRQASGGSLLIDEVSVLSDRAQLALARHLESYVPDGPRWIATSNQDLDRLVADGLFRKDLFFRLARLRIELPPLHRRPADIGPFAQAFLGARGVDAPLSRAVLEALERYPWPGNLRELETVMARAALASGGAPIDLVHLPPPLQSPWPRASEPPLRPAEPHAAPPSAAAEDEVPSSGGDLEAAGAGSAASPLGPSLREEMAALERRRILEALERCPNQTEAARALGIPLRTFLNRMDALGIPRARKK